MKTLLGPTNIGWYAFILCLPLSWYYLDRTVLIRYPYREGLTALLSAGNFLPLMVGAIASAWEGGRHSTTSVGIPTSVRHPLTIASLGVLPTFLTVAGSHLLASVVVLAANDVTPPFPAPWLTVGFLSILFAVSIASWFAGYFLSNVIGAPLMAVLIYLLAIMPTLTSHHEYRAFIADHSGCCGLSEQVDVRAIASPVVLAMGVVLITVTLASWLWLRKGLYPLFGVAGGMLLLFGLALPGAMTDPWAVSARDAAHLECSTSSRTAVEYCVWPEQRVQLEALQTTGDNALQHWQRDSLVMQPARVAPQDTSHPEPGLLSIALPPDATTGEIILALAFGALPDPSLCQGPGLDGSSYYSLVIWLAVEGGASIDDPAFEQFRGAGRTSPQDKVIAQQSAPKSEQLSWFNRSVGLLFACQGDSDQ